MVEVGVEVGAVMRSNLVPYVVEVISCLLVIFEAELGVDVRLKSTYL
jgi:hypothetical protein